METEIVFYKNNNWEAECQYNREEQTMKNPTAFVTKLVAYQVEYIMHSTKTKEVKDFIKKLYEEHKPQEEKFKLTWYSKEISSIIRQYE